MKSPGEVVLFQGKTIFKRYRGMGSLGRDGEGKQ